MLVSNKQWLSIKVVIANKAIDKVRNGRNTIIKAKVKSLLTYLLRLNVEVDLRLAVKTWA